MKKSKKVVTDKVDVKPVIPIVEAQPKGWSGSLKMLRKPPAAFTQALAREIVKNISALGEFTARPFRRATYTNTVTNNTTYINPILVDTSILIDGRIVPIINSGFMAGTFLVAQFVLSELQHIADDTEVIRRTKGRRGLDVLSKIKSQKNNELVKMQVLNEDVPGVKEVDHKLVELAKKHGYKLLTVDFNLAQMARIQGVKVLNINDLAQAIKIALVPGEELTIRITHAGKEREQGVGYLEDGTMVVVDNAKNQVGSDLKVIVTKIHQTPAGQLFFARPT